MADHKYRVRVFDLATRAVLETYERTANSGLDACAQVLQDHPEYRNPSKYSIKAYGVQG